MKQLTKKIFVYGSDKTRYILNLMTIEREREREREEGGRGREGEEGRGGREGARDGERERKRERETRTCKQTHAHATTAWTHVLPVWVYRWQIIQMANHTRKN